MQIHLVVKMKLIRRMKLSITPPIILGAICLGLLMMWLGSAFEFILWLRLTLLFGGGIFLMCAFGYCTYHLTKHLMKIFKIKF